MNKLREHFFRAGEAYRRVVKYHHENEDRSGTAEFKIHDAFLSYKKAGDKLQQSKKV